MSDWTASREPHPFAGRERRFDVTVMTNAQGQKMVVDKATKKWFAYGPEELNRQFEEQYLHDEYRVPWRRIVSEAPIKMGSETRRADIVILRNENLPIEPSNYLEIIEVKKTGGDIEGARGQVLSYMTNSAAIRGTVSDLRTRTGFVKTIAGKVISVDSSGSSKEDLLERAELRKLPISREVLLYARYMKRMLATVKVIPGDPLHPEDSEQFAKRFVAFWLQETKAIEAHGHGSFWVQNQ